jgi:hypothetical protein
MILRTTELRFHSLGSSGRPRVRVVASGLQGGRPEHQHLEDPEHNHGTRYPGAELCCYVTKCALGFFHDPQGARGNFNVFVNFRRKSFRVYYG